MWRGNPASPLSSEGAWVMGPNRYASYSQFSVRCTPMSSVGRYRRAASLAQGAGTMIEAQVATPTRRES